jgi:hypothetical protein
VEATLISFVDELAKRGVESHKSDLHSILWGELLVLGRVYLQRASPFLKSSHIIHWAIEFYISGGRFTSGGKNPSYVGHL